MNYRSSLRSSQKGFTLIELMVVVAIIGILAGIAIPQYQTYVAKSQLTRVVSETGALKTTIEACILDGKLAIGDAATDTKHCDPQATASTLINGGRQGGGAAPAANTGMPQVLATLTGKGGDTITSLIDYSATAALKDRKVQWTRDASGSWSCLTDAEQKYAPPACPKGVIR